MDISNYTGDLSETQLDDLWAAGVRHVVVRLSLESESKRFLAIRQLHACALRGFTVSGYLWCYPETSEADVRSALLIATSAGVRLTMLWLDAEEDGVTVDQLRSLADTTASMGQRVGLYSGEWFLAGLGDLAPLADLPLWLAFYDGVADLSAWHQFGPWTKLAGKQYAGDSTIAGIASVDLNIFAPDVAA